MKAFPRLNAEIQDDEIILKHYYDFGIAVGAEEGLVVPVIRDVPNLGLRQIAAQSRELIDRARGGKLASRDMSDGCFTITNLAGFGIDAFTWIDNAGRKRLLPRCEINARFSMGWAIGMGQKGRIAMLA